MDSRFAIMPRKLFEDALITGFDLAVYGALDSFSDENGVCWPGLPSIAKRAKVSRPTVSAALTRLETRGYIRRERRREVGKKEYGTTKYWLLFRLGVGNDITEVGKEISDVGNDNTDRSESTFTEVGNQVAGKYTHIRIPKEEYAESLDFSFSESPSSDRSQEHFEEQKPKNKDEGAGGEVADRERTAAKAWHNGKVSGHFVEFWATYPNKDGEKAAREAFRKLFPFGRKPETHLATLRRINDRLSAILEKIGSGEKKPQYVPQAKNWLRSEDFSHD